MIEGKTKSGFEYKIEDAAMDNMELLDLLGEIDKGKTAAITDATVLLLGKEQKKRLYEHIRTEEGNVPIELFIKEFTEILNSKNS